MLNCIYIKLPFGVHLTGHWTSFSQALPVQPGSHLQKNVAGCPATVDGTLVQVPRSLQAGAHLFACCALCFCAVITRRFRFEWEIF